jgi:hypothetical protein
MPSALGKQSTSWREQSFWSKVGVIACLAFLMILPGYSDAAGLGGGSSGRKQVFSHGFVVLCIFVAVIELIALSHYYDA